MFEFATGRRLFSRARSRAISQVGLRVVVVVDEIATQVSAWRIEDNPEAQTGTDFVEPGGQASQ